MMVSANAAFLSAMLPSSVQKCGDPCPTCHYTGQWSAWSDCSKSCVTGDFVGDHAVDGAGDVGHETRTRSRYAVYAAVRATASPVASPTGSPTPPPTVHVMPGYPGGSSYYTARHNLDPRETKARRLRTAGTKVSEPVVHWESTSSPQKARDYYMQQTTQKRHRLAALKAELSFAAQAKKQFATTSGSINPENGLNCNPAQGIVTDCHMPTTVSPTTMSPTTVSPTPEPTPAKADCPPVTQRRPCSSLPPPCTEDCAMSTWGAWNTTCSRTCGGGVLVRRRAILHQPR
jgi:hypothetical protein